MRALWVGAIKSVTLNEVKGLVETNAAAKRGRLTKSNRRLPLPRRFFIPLSLHSE